MFWKPFLILQNDFFFVSFRETENFSSSVFGHTEYKAATKMWWTYDGADDTACCSDVQQKIAEVTFSLILKTNVHELRQGLACPRPENMLLTTPRRIKKKRPENKNITLYHKHYREHNCTLQHYSFCQLEYSKEAVQTKIENYPC